MTHCNKLHFLSPFPSLVEGSFVLILILILVLVLGQRLCIAIWRHVPGEPFVPCPDPDGDTLEAERVGFASIARDAVRGWSGL